MTEFVKCPKCGKWGHLTLKQVKSYRYGFVSIIGGEVISILESSGRRRAQQLGLLVDWSDNDERHPYRLKITYGPWIYPYIRHYDPEKYRRAMIDYKNGKLKARPNGLKWCKVRMTPRPGENISEWNWLGHRYDNEFSISSLEEQIEREKWLMRLRRYVKVTRKYKSLHPIFNIVSVVVAEPKYSVERTILS